MGVVEVVPSHTWEINCSGVFQVSCMVGRVLVTGRGISTVSQCASSCFTVKYKKKENKREKSLVVLSVWSEGFLFSVQRNKPGNATSSQNESCFPVVVLPGVGCQQFPPRRQESWVHLTEQGSDWSFQLFFVAETCQHGLCVEILLGRGQKGSFQILW